MSAPALRCGLIGCGFFARNHAHAWAAIEGAELVAVSDVDPERARSFAGDFHVPASYADPAEMLERERLDFVDVVTQPHTHRALVEQAAAAGLQVICQKPLAPTLEDAAAMVEACRRAGVRFMVHENFRWQAPMRALARAAGRIGPVFFGRIAFRSGYDVYAAQPYLATDERFIVYDLGVHLLDLVRFFAGEPERLYCRTQRVNPRIRAEDVATILLDIRGGGACVVEMSYASRLERELFPQTLVHLEGPEGSAVLGADYRITLTTAEGVTRTEAPPEPLGWTSEPGRVVQESVLRIQRHWVECLREEKEPETSGEDNLRTLALVEAAYESAGTRRVAELNA